MPNDSFSADLARLPARIPTANCTAEWEWLYENEVSGMNPIELALRGTGTVLSGLVETAEAATGRHWPTSPEGGRTILLLRRKGENGIPLAELLHLPVDELSVDDQLWLRQCAPRVVEETIVFAKDFGPYLQEDEVAMAYRLLVHTPLREDVSLTGLAENVAEYVGRFATDVRVAIENGYLAGPYGIIPVRVHQRAMDFLQRFRSRSIAHLADDDPFYELDFADVIRFAPSYAWMRGGYVRRGGVPDIAIGDANWCHLAAGGSWRKLPDGRPMTRGMAKLLATPARWGQFHRAVDDHYLAAYALSLRVNPEICEAAAQHLRRVPDDPAQQQAEFDRWNDILQVLHRLATQPGDRTPTQQDLYLLFEWLALRLRDQPDYSITGYTNDQLFAEVDAAHERWAERQAIRRQREQERLERLERKNPEEPQWPALSTHQDLEYTDEKGRKTRFFELTRASALRYEGKVMGHCVGGNGYVSSCQDAGGRVFSLRQLDAAKNQWRSLVTLHLVRDYDRRGKLKLVEMRGRFNGDPAEWMEKRVDAWREANDIGDGVWW